MPLVSAVNQNHLQEQNGAGLLLETNSQIHELIPLAATEQNTALAGNFVALSANGSYRTRPAALVLARTR